MPAKAAKMSAKTSFYANQLREEIRLRNQQYARGRSHVESYGSAPVIVYAPEGARHGNFFDAAYAAITARPEWLRRFDKVHAQASRSLPRAERRWRELDSSTSSDALLMNVFCTPGVLASASLRIALGVEDNVAPRFGWKARVPLSNGRFDRTEVDMRLGSLLVEAKLTESDFQTCSASVAESYRDFDTVFDRELLPCIELPPKRRRPASEFPEDYSQEFESFLVDPADDLGKPYEQHAGPNTSSRIFVNREAENGGPGYASYQLIRNVLAAHSEECTFCVLHDERRPDLREEWFQVMSAVKSAELRTRLKVLTWQELAAFLPGDLQTFLAQKYGIVAPGSTSSAFCQDGNAE